MPKLTRTEEMARDFERVAARLEDEATALRKAAAALRGDRPRTTRRRAKAAS